MPLSIRKTRKAKVGDIFESYITTEGFLGKETTRKKHGATVAYVSKDGSEFQIEKYGEIYMTRHLKDTGDGWREDRYPDRWDV